MRDKNRIPEFTKELERIWIQCYPDWRFGQLMRNFMNYVALEYKRDPFLPEEAEMLKYLKNMQGKVHFTRRIQSMSKKNYKYVPRVKYGDNSGWMGDKFSTMQKAWDYLMEHKMKHDTDNDTVFIGVIKCKKDENPFTRIVDIGIRSYSAWE